MKVVKVLRWLLSTLVHTCLLWPCTLAGDAMPGLSEKTPLRASSAASSSELPGATVAAYAAPSVPSSARDVFVTLYLRKFYIDYLGIPPGRLAVVDASVHALDTPSTRPEVINS